MKKMKKVLASLLAATMVMSMSVTAFAAKDNTDAKFTKTYKETNEASINPEETFTFSFEGYQLTDSNANLTVKDMPKIDDVTVKFDANAATVNGLAKDVDVALSTVTWPGVGVYYYKVTEKAGNTAGVTYDKTTAYLKITVAYDEGTATYYTAFVTLNLADENGDGLTDSKTGGFVNTYSAGDLAITKNVTGNLGDQNKEFTVRVTFTAPSVKDGEGNTVYLDVNSEISCSDDETIKIITVEDGKEVKTEVAGNKITSETWGDETTITLEISVIHDETVTFTNIPYGVTYTVVEDDFTSQENGGYDKATYKFADDDKAIDSAEDTVTITNNKGTTVDTGIILDSAPYVLLLALAAAGMFAVVNKKREDEI